jgi:hypothetical protein
MGAGLIRFLTSDLKLVEIDHDQAAASLTEAFEESFGHRPNYDERTGDAATGFYLPSSSDEGQVMIQRKANGRAVRRALWLLSAKHSLDGIRLVTQPQGTNAIPSDYYWNPAGLPAYDQSEVTVWPVEPSWPVRDRVVVAYTDNAELFVHRARRNPQCDWCVPAKTVDEALSFASVERAQAWIDLRGSSERHPLRPKYRSAAAALLEQAPPEHDEAAG